MTSSFSQLYRYADHSALNTISENPHVVKSNLEANFAFMQKWFYENHMTPGTCHYMLIGKYEQPDEMNKYRTEL